jgi:hypothetical protein
MGALQANTPTGSNNFKRIFFARDQRHGDE